jgi:tellurite resistance-related uncharacterized protein
MTDQIPNGFVLARTTPTFDNDSVPAGLLSAHRVADDVWGRLVVHTGKLTFVFEDQPGTPIPVAANGGVVIPPARPHHLELDGPATFAVEFYRSRSSSPTVDAKPESSGLESPADS